MKNILIVTVCRDNQLPDHAFFTDISEITDPVHRTMVEKAINKESWELDGFSSDDYDYGDGSSLCFGDDYIFGDESSKLTFPLVVEHFVRYIVN